jgi:ATP-dependent DNA ligase
MGAGDRTPERAFALEPPIEPMLAKLVDALPEGDGWIYEPKWDGFRAIVYRSPDDVYIQSRDLRPLDRYFPELHDACVAQLPPGCILDGEIVIATSAGLDFDALQLRLHPAASRVDRLARETPSAFIAFDLLAENGIDLRTSPQEERRDHLEKLVARLAPPIHLTPATRSRTLAAEWLERFEGAGLDGVIAKPLAGTYEPGRRAMFKIKHVRTADCVVGGFRWHKSGRDAIGSLLLGLYDDDGALHHVGVTSAFTMAERRSLVHELAPLREGALEGHPWREWAEWSGHELTRMPGGGSRWSAGKDMSWEPLRIERVCEVKYDHLQGPRFRHAAVFLRWRLDRSPSDCRYAQLEVVSPFALEKVFAAGGATAPLALGPRRPRADAPGSRRTTRKDRSR